MNYPTTATTDKPDKPHRDPRSKRVQENNLAIASETPKIHVLRAAIEEALGDINFYYQRNQNAADWWHARWPNQTIDGRKHAGDEGDDCFPWEGASDTRMQMMSRLIREHVMVSKFAFLNAKVQARSIRPFAGVRVATAATRLLQWMLYTHMQAELARELPLAWAWRFGYGAAFLGIEWEQERRVENVEISIPMLDEFIQASGGDPAMAMIMESIMDPAREDLMLELVQALSPIVTRTKARRIVKDLRELRSAEVPVPYTYKSKPRWTALRAGVDLVFPSDTSDLQRAPWVARREWVSETELIDRIETEDYDGAFVDELLQHKGQSYNSAVWTVRTEAERSKVGSRNYEGGNRDFAGMYELYHCLYKTIDEGTPCLYRTVFSPHAVGKDRDNPLYATHGLFPYQHGQYPYIPLRFELDDRPILSSRGIPEIGYTWEQELKVQFDGRADRTAIVLNPPMIVPTNRVNAIRSQYGPRAILGVTRPNEVAWPPLPPTDQSPELIGQMVERRVEDWFALFGQQVDPEKKSMRRIELSSDVLGEVNLAIDQTLKLMQQYEPEEDVTAVVGELQRPFNISRRNIQGAFEITATFDARMLNEDYQEKKLQLIGQAMGYNQAGTANMSKLFRVAMEAIDIDLADEVVEDDQPATEREKTDELMAVNAAMNGLEMPLPQQGNHQLRLQTLMSATLQSQNPEMAKRLQQNPDTIAILQNRIKFFQNQVQQNTQNAQIGRMLSTQTFSKEAPQAQSQMILGGGE